MSAPERFSSRWGLLLATLGMAVGTGNIWRFPRVVANNEGGSFLIAWVVFLLLWSVPLMMVEFAFGKRTRQGCVAAFTRLAGKGRAWMGGWVALCATAIMFYYSVVAGWCLRYLAASLTGELERRSSAEIWDGFAASGGAVLTHALALGAAFAVVWFGVRGIERVARVLIPSLAVLVVILTVRAVTLPGAERGLDFLFRPRWAALAEPSIWLEALTQNAWDTGAGWGLILTYAVYMRVREDVPLNAFLIGFGNNSMSLLAGIMVLCTVFAVNPSAQTEIVGAGNEGLTFVWMPRLFAAIPGGGFFMALFFLALSFAALTSLISMLELATRVLCDFGLPRRRALGWVGAGGFVLGVPSALSMTFFRNQDWVWSVGLAISGLFFALAARRFGVEMMRRREVANGGGVDLWPGVRAVELLRREVVNGEGADLRVGPWWTGFVAVLIPLEAIALVGWWLWGSYQSDPSHWLAPFGTYSVGAVLLQGGIALVALVAANRWLARRTAATAAATAAAPGDAA